MEERPSVGLPIPGEVITDVEDTRRPAIGEILVRGDNVMLGYYHRPSLQSGYCGRLVHTGDYGYIDTDGFLYITGHKKNVIVRKRQNSLSKKLRSTWRQACCGCAVIGGRSDDGESILITAIIYPTRYAKTIGLDDKAAIDAKLRTR